MTYSIDPQLFKADVVAIEYEDQVFTFVHRTKEGVYKFNYCYLDDVRADYTLEDWLQCKKFVTFDFNSTILEIYKDLGIIPNVIFDYSIAKNHTQLSAVVRRVKAEANAPIYSLQLLLAAGIADTKELDLFRDSIAFHTYRCYEEMCQEDTGVVGLAGLDLERSNGLDCSLIPILVKSRAMGIPIEEELLDVYYEEELSEVLLDEKKRRKITTAYNNIKKHITDGRFHPRVGLLNSSRSMITYTRPNTTVVPRFIRRAMVAPEGHQYLSISYPNMEFKIAGALSGEELLKMDGDFHTEVARRMFNSPDVTDQMRTIAKAANFYSMYGGLTGHWVSKIDLGVYDAQKLVDNHRELFPKFSNWWDKMISLYKEYGYIKTTYRKLDTVEHLRRVPPFYIQNEGQDLAKQNLLLISTLKIPHEFVFSFHGELVYKVPDNYVEAFKEEAPAICLGEFKGVGIKVRVAQHNNLTLL
jgi:hypothetical protein